MWINKAQMLTITVWPSKFYGCHLLFQKDPNQTVGETTIKFIRGDGSKIRPDFLEVTYTIDRIQRTKELENISKEFKP